MESIAVKVKIGDEVFSEYGFYGDSLPVEGMVINRGMELYIVDSVVQTEEQYQITLIPAIRGHIFNIKDHQWSHKLCVSVSFGSMLDYDNGGDDFTITEFIDMAKSGGISDYDGFSDELVLNGKVIAENVDLVDVMNSRDEFLEFEKEFPGARIVWYNK